jgi:hypothetical protein
MTARLLLLLMRYIFQRFDKRTAILMETVKKYIPSSAV